MPEQGPAPAALSTTAAVQKEAPPRGIVWEEMVREAEQIVADVGASHGLDQVCCRLSRRKMLRVDICSSTAEVGGPALAQ